MTDSRQLETRRRSNLRLGLILATVAMAFALGFVTKIAFFSN